MSLYLYSPPNCEKTAHLPCKSDAQRQGYCKWMLCTVGLDVSSHRDIVLQAWLNEEADVGCQVIFQTEAKCSRELPWSTESGLIAGFIDPT